MTQYCIITAIFLLAGFFYGRSVRRLRRVSDELRMDLQLAQEDLRDIRIDVNDARVAPAHMLVRSDSFGAFISVYIGKIEARRFRYNSDNGNDYSYALLCAEELTELLNRKP